MLTNYHTHTWRCHHAEEDENAYVQSALDTGIRVLGFSDHAPYPFDGGYKSGFRMDCDMLSEYMQTLLSLQEAYRGQIEMHIGFEAEYYPRYFSKLLDLLAPTAYEYLILGQHFLGNEQGELPCSTPTDSADRLRAYTDQCCAAMQTGAFSCLAHPDLLQYTGDDAIYRAEARRLCREAKACGMPLEINLLGIGGHRHYPREPFWEEAAVVGCDVIIGWDAHTRDWMRQTQWLACAREMIARLGLHQIETMHLYRPV